MGVVGSHYHGLKLLSLFTIFINTFRLFNTSGSCIFLISAAIIGFDQVLQAELCSKGHGHLGHGRGVGKNL